MTIIDCIFVVLGVALLWSFYQDYKVNKAHKKALLDKQKLLAYKQERK